MAIQTHPNHITINDSAILWRYMSLPKYESLLKEHALFFCRADKFADPFECTIPKREYEYRLSPEKFFKEELLFGRTNSRFNAEIASNNAKDLADTHKIVKTATTVNCWHINDNESDAMWRLYLKDNEGIAIQTNYLRLKKAFNSTPENIGASRVRYINYDTDIWYHVTEFPVDGYNFFTPVIHKRIEFVHENEFRLYHHEDKKEVEGFWDTQPNTIGEFIKIDVSSLIESVFFHPTADEKTVEKIRTLTKNTGFSLSFKSSNLSSPPLY